MSWENLKDAYRTRLGNLTAKSVLVLIVDEANAEGLACVGLDRIATLTEIDKRTVQRFIQVFSAIGLVERTSALLKGRFVPALQVNLTKLSLDLTEEFGPAHRKALGRSAYKKRLTDASEGVCQTSESVCQTQEGVCQTLPPDPLIGISPLVPLSPLTPLPPQGGGEFTEEQLEHIARCREENRAGIELHYREENRLAAERAQEQRAKAKQQEQLKALLPDEPSAVAWVMRECGWVGDERKRGVRGALAAVIAERARAGEELWRLAPAIVEAKRAYYAISRKPQYGPLNFIKLGIWDQAASWR